MVNFSVDIPPIPLYPTFVEDDCRRVWIKNTWTTTGGGERDAKYQLPVCGTQDIENLCYVIREFKENMASTRLHLTTGPERFSKFREVLHGVVRDIWDEVLRVATNANCTTNDHFSERLGEFMAKFLDESSISIQEEYLLSEKKRYAFSVEWINLRIDKINVYMRMWPGDNDTPLSETKKKQILHSLMLEPWKQAFANNGHRWSSDTTSRDQMVEYFTLQSQAMDRSRSQYPTQQRNKYPRTSYGGRGNNNSYGNQSYGSTPNRSQSYQPQTPSRWQPNRSTHTPYPQTTPRFAPPGGRTPFRSGRGNPSFGGRGSFIPSPPRFQRGGGRFPVTPGRGGPGRGNFGRGPPGGRTPARAASLYSDNYFQEPDNQNSDQSYDDQYWSQASEAGYADPHGHADFYYQHDDQRYDYASNDADAYFQGDDSQQPSAQPDNSGYDDGYYYDPNYQDQQW